jgi:hypothetical protein
VPASAPEAGGLVRVDLTGSGCTQVWSSSIRSAAVPKLSVADGRIYTTTRTGLIDPAQTGLLDTYREVVLDAATGAVVSTGYLGTSSVFDTLQLAGAVDRHRTLWQGTLTGILRVG